MDLLAPFGCENPEPLLCARNLKASSASIVGNNHLKMKLISKSISRDSIWFSRGDFLPAISGANMDVVFTPHINYWNGASDIQLKMKDVSILD
jgi:single-stranded-DNA-specific exonuclease